MKVVIKGGCDTPFYLADVYLESEEEKLLTEDQIWEEIGKQAEKHRIYALHDVVSYFRYVRGEGGEWESFPKYSWN